MINRLLLSCAALLSGLACTSVDPIVEDRLTISSGIYGQTTSLDDVGDHSPEYMSMELTVTPSSDDGARVSTVRSDEAGFFESELLPGSYSICTTFGRCADFDVQPGQCVRLDYEFGPGPGWSQSTSIDCPPGK
jgi:hypothetical protein